MAAKGKGLIIIFLFLSFYPVVASILSFDRKNALHRIMCVLYSLLCVCVCACVYMNVCEGRGLPVGFLPKKVKFSFYGHGCGTAIFSLLVCVCVSV